MAKKGFVLQGSGRTPFPSLSLGERRLILCILDLLALNLGLLWALALRPQYGFDLGLLRAHPQWFGILSFLWLLWAWALDAYEPRIASKTRDSLRAASLALLLSVGILLLVPYLSPPLPPRRWLLFAMFLCPLGAIGAGRGIYLLLLRHPAFLRRLLILGAGWEGRMVLEALREHGDSGLEVVGFVDDGVPMGEEVGGVRVLGDRHRLRDLVSEGGVNTIVVAAGGEVDGELLGILMDCVTMGVEVVPAPLLYEELTGRVPVEFVEGTWHISMPINHPLTKPINRALKRIFDVVLASVGLAFLLLLFPFVALAIKLDSPGPVFYTQWRVGRGGRPFRLYKFRSMVRDAEREGPLWARKGDPRVTRVGKVLRRTHLDEFPQLFNVLKGEMSVVGPRPERPEFVEELSREIPFFSVRHAVKPGMAGWGLVKYGYAASKEDSLMKLQYDLYYIKHWSPWLDLVILLKTVIDTVTFRGR